MAHTSNYDKVYVGDTGLTIDEVRRAVGANTTDLGTLCRHENVNPWAKYKPTKYNGWKSETVAMPHYWQGDNGLCGFTCNGGHIVFENFYAGTLQHSFIDNLRLGNLAWRRELPDAFFRLLDFNGYIRDAKSPAPYVTQKDITLEQGHTDYHITIGVPVPLNEGNLKLEDFGTGLGVGGIDFKAEDLYAGICIVDVLRNRYLCGTTTQTVGQIISSVGPGADEVFVDVHIGALQDYALPYTWVDLVAIPFLSSVAFSNITSSNAEEIEDGIFLSAPGGEQRLRLYTPYGKREWPGFYWTTAYIDPTWIVIEFEIDTEVDANDVVLSFGEMLSNGQYSELYKWDIGHLDGSDAYGPYRASVDDVLGPDFDPTKHYVAKLTSDEYYDTATDVDVL